MMAAERFVVDSNLFESGNRCLEQLYNLKFFVQKILIFTLI